MGGGARTAYQVGVLNALAAMLKLNHGEAAPFPFQVLVGTSAGALNTTCLAGFAHEGLRAFDRLARFWNGIRSQDVYELNASPWVKTSRVLAAISLARHAKRHGALLSNMPLVDTLHRAVSLPGIERGLQSGVLSGVAVTAASYTSGVHWTFCQTAPEHPFSPWQRPGRRAEQQPLTIEHLMASSAIPFMFPATALWADGQREFFGDGSIRHTSPLSPALHLGADKILVVGVAQPQRSSMMGDTAPGRTLRPTLGGIAGHALASVFQDTLLSDVEQTLRINDAIRRLPHGHAGHLPFRPIEVLALQPSQSLDALAQAHAHELPTATRHTLGGLGALKGAGAALASYLMFEPGFVQALMALGERDAYARKAELLAFLK